LEEPTQISEAQKNAISSTAANALVLLLFLILVKHGLNVLVNFLIARQAQLL